MCLSQVSWDLVRAGFRWIYLDLVRLLSRGYRFDLLDVQLSSSAMVPILVHWSIKALARRLLDCLLQQGFPAPMTEAQ